MRKLILVAAGVAVLATAGLAVAKSLGPARSDEVSATFAATTAVKTDTKTCTTSDNRTIVVTQGQYTGTSTGDADVSGPITVGLRVTVDQTAKVGLATGRVHISAAGRDTNALLTGVYHDGKLAGLLAGGARTPGVRLLGNFSADFTAAGGLTGGKIGHTSGGDAIELGPTKCARGHGTKEESSARGTVTALSDGSITVAALTCDIPADMSQKVNDALDVGDRAQIDCKLDAGHNVLDKFSKKK